MAEAAFALELTETGEQVWRATQPCVDQPEELPPASAPTGVTEALFSWVGDQPRMILVGEFGTSNLLSSLSPLLPRGYADLSLDKDDGFVIWANDIGRVSFRPESVLFVNPPPGGLKYGGRLAVAGWQLICYEDRLTIKLTHFRGDFPGTQTNDPKRDLLFIVTPVRVRFADQLDPVVVSVPGPIGPKGDPGIQGPQGLKGDNAVVDQATIDRVAKATTDRFYNEAPAADHYGLPRTMWQGSRLQEHFLIVLWNQAVWQGLIGKIREAWKNLRGT